MKLTPRRLDELLTQVGELLTDRAASIEAVAIGGGSLMLLGLIKRPTRDLDLVAVIENGTLRRAEPMPESLRQAVDDVARLNNIDPHWMNAAPSSLMDQGLPPGFMERAERRQYGGLVLHLATRVDQIALKLYAAVDQGPDSKHVADLILLAPTSEELRLAARWTRLHDPSPGFHAILLAVLEHFGVSHDGDI